MTTTARIILTGFMGAGKTTVAAALAERLDCTWRDLDDLIAQRTGRTVPALIDREGEAHFRALETEALHLALLQAEPRILALGGGAWTLARNRDLIAARGCLTVWLDAPFAVCWARIVGIDNTRPLARDCRQAEILYAERHNFYRLAALRVDAGQEIVPTVSAICAALACHAKENYEQ